MPEGDTIYKLARRLERDAAGATIVHSDFRVPQLATRDVADRQVLGYETHGKHVFMHLSGDVRVHSHLRMDGQWRVTTGQGPGVPMHQVRLILRLDNGRTLWGVRLHELALCTRTGQSELTKHLGPDPLRDDWDVEVAIARLSSDPHLPLVSALLDQTRMAGLGNFWVNELAFLHGVSPWTPIGDVDISRLVRKAALALRHSATAPRAYHVTTGRTARGLQEWVYGRAHQPCRRCHSSIQVVSAVADDAAQRRTWWCPSCQPGPQRPG